MLNKIAISILLLVFTFNIKIVCNEDISIKLINAVACNNVEEVKELIKQGANVNIQRKALTGYNESNLLYKNTSTPLHDATRDMKINIVKVLLEAGAIVNYVDELGNTALHKALILSVQKEATYFSLLEKKSFLSRLRELINILLVAGIAKDIKNNVGKKALEYTENQEIKDLINSYMPICRS